MAVRIWSTVPLARASASGLERRHWASSALRTASSIRRSPDSSRSCASRGTGPACSQRSWMPRRAARAARTSVTGTSFPASSSNWVLTVGVLAQRGVLRRVHLRPGPEEGVLRGLEPAPQLVLVRPGRPARRLPGPHQLTEGGGGGGPVGGVGERLRLRAQLLLARLGLVALLGQFGEVGLAALVEGIAGRRQPFPQRGLHRAVGSRRGLPFLQQLPQPLAAVLPVRRLGRDLLGLGDDGFLDAPGLGAHLVTLRADLFLALVHLPGQRLQPGLKLAEVADRVRVGHRRPAAARSPRGPGRATDRWW